MESDLGGWDVTAFGDRSRSGGVFRSEDRGDSWKRLEDHTPRGFYFSKIRVDPTDDQRVYRLGWGLDVSDDGGRHFRAGAARKPHGDMHDLVVDPADRDHLLMGTDGGIYVSRDRGETWDFLNGVALGEFYNVAVDDSDPYRIGGGLQDNGSWIGPSATNRAAGGDMPDDPGPSITNADWQFVNDGDGFHVAFDPTDRNIVYAESQGGVLARVHLDTAKVKLLKPSPKEGSPRYRFNWNSPFFVSVHNPRTLYLGGNYVFRLTDRGDAWEKISEDLSTRAVEKLETVGSEAETHCTVVSLAESPRAAGTLWAGSDDGLLHVTTDDGKTWADVTPPMAGGRYVSRIEAAHQDAATAYVSLDGHRMDDMDPHVVMTGDMGKAWTDITGDLPKGAHVVVVREDLTTPSVLYAGTERGIFVTIDRGKRWVRFNGESLPTVAVDDIVQHPREKDLVVGTHGRSIYVLDDASAFSQMSAEVINKPLHLFDMQPARPRQSMALGGMWSHRMFGAPNPAMGARITYWVREYDDEPVKISITDKGGAVVRSLGGSNRPGLNRAVWDLQREKYDQLPFPEAEFGQKQFVPPGDYTVTVTQGKQKMSRSVTVTAEP